MPNSKSNIVYFGGSRFSVLVLNALVKEGLVPDLIVTTSSKPQGRGLVPAPTLVTHWATQRNIPVLEPTKLDQNFVATLSTTPYTLFIVASYGKIIPQVVLDIPKRGTLNVHPSLLPKYRGASPLQSQILADDRDVGVSIMLLDAEMDHGDIVAQETVSVTPWPPTCSALEEKLAESGGQLLARTIPRWINGTIAAQAQNHAAATFTKKVDKSDGELHLATEPYANYLKYCAYKNTIGTFFIAEKITKRGTEKIRVKIQTASYEDGVFTPLRVIPAGGREMPYADFLRGLK